MNKILKVLVSRGFGLTLSILVQVVFWVAIFFVFGDYSTILVEIMVVISFFCALSIIIKDIYPEHKIAWIIVIFLFPIAGGIFYLLFGTYRRSKKSKALYAKREEKLLETIRGLEAPDFSRLPADHSKRQVEYLKNIANAPAFEHTSITYFEVGEKMWTELLAQLKKAEHFIFIESFIIEPGKMWNNIEEILIEKAKSGVDVRILFDDLGCLLTLPNDFEKRLQKHQIKCKAFNKANHVLNANFNNRDHRKICIIDGNIGFNGGINLADEYINEKVVYGHWKDTAIMLQGEGVYGLTLMFLEMWDTQIGKIDDDIKFKPTICATSDGIVQPFADTPLDEHSVGESIYMSILDTAKEYVYITTPYLIITREMTVSLTNAAKSGIDVRLILPGIPDKKFVQFLSRSYYASLVKAGVKIYEYSKGFVHSKMFIADDHTAIVGTINLDYRSLDLHYECGTMMYGCSVIPQIRKDFLNTQKECLEITYEMIKSDSKLDIFKFILLGILRSFSPLM